MDIWWYGHSCFRLRSKEGIALTDPFSSKLGLSPPRITPDVITISHEHQNHSDLAGLKGDFFVVRDPGEYEVKGIFITGVWSYHDAKEGAEGGRNTIFVLEMDDLRVCHLGDLGHVPTDEMIEEMGDVDVLLVPVGGSTTIGPAEASEVISLLEPRVVIPMHFAQQGSKAKLGPVEEFLKELGLKPGESVDQLRISRSSLPSDTEIVLLQSRG